MNKIILTILCLILLLGLFIFIVKMVKKKLSFKHPTLIKKIQILQPYINQRLSLEDSYIFLELLREITVELVALSQLQLTSTRVKEITNKLLGFVLAIPRINEENENLDPIITAIQQIEIVTQICKEAQEYLNQNISELISYLS